MEKKVTELLTKISDLPCRQKLVENEKQKLLSYLRNNEKRINYGLFKELDKESNMQKKHIAINAKRL